MIQIEGIGIGRLTANFKSGTLNGALRGTDQEAIQMIYYLMKYEGICLGPSAALNLVGAVKVVCRASDCRLLYTAVVIFHV